MSLHLQIDSSTRADPGRVRENNEDAVGRFEPTAPEVLRERGRLYIVADGMGGEAAGEVASNFAVEKILHAYYDLPWNGPEQTLVAAIAQANTEIHLEGARNDERRGMGSTVVAVAVVADQAVIAHVGDSRAYLLRDGVLDQITADHSWVAERVREGIITPEEAAVHPNRNILTRNLGSRPDVNVSVMALPLQRGDRLLLCSDGLWGVLPPEEIAALAGRGGANRAVSALVQAANAAGSPDNIGIALVVVGGHGGRSATTRDSGVPSAAPPSSLSPTRRFGVVMTDLRSSPPMLIVLSLLLTFLVLAVLLMELGPHRPASTEHPQSQASATQPGIQSTPAPQVPPERPAGAGDTGAVNQDQAGVAAEVDTFPWDGSGNPRSFPGLSDIAVDGSGNLYIVVSSGDFPVFKVFPAQQGPQGQVVPFTDSTLQFSQPKAIAVKSGIVYVADAGNKTIAAIDIQVHGSNAPISPIVKSGLQDPRGIAVNKDGTIYVADAGANVIWQVAKDNHLTRFAGGGNLKCGGRLPTDIALNSPRGVTVDDLGNIYVADSGNNRIVEFKGNSTYIFGDQCASGNDGRAVAQSGGVLFSDPRALAVDGRGNVFVASFGNNQIIEIESDSQALKLVNGSSTSAHFSGDREVIKFSQPSGIAVDAHGIVYVADSGSEYIRRITLTP